MGLKSLEAKRLAALAAGRLADSSPDPALDRLTRLAAEACRAPMAMLALAGSDCVWIKSCYGFKPEHIPCAGSACAQAILAHDVLVLHENARILPGVRFYTGVPLIAGGVTLGALGVLDTAPRRRLRAPELASLRDLAVLAGQEIERRIPAPEYTLQPRAERANADVGVAALVWATDPKGSCTLLKRFQVDAPACGEPGHDALVLESRTRRSDGGDRWVLQQAAPRFGPDGGFAGYVGVCLDTTARKLAERALRQTREWLDLAQVAAGVGFWNWDIVSDQCQCTDQYFRLYGIEPRAKFSFADWQMLLHPDDRRPLASFLDRLADPGNRQYENRFRCVWPDGTVHWLVSKARVELDESGRPARILGANIDISRFQEAEQRCKQAERELVASREQLRHLAAHAEAARESERIRMAREIHDELGQMLSVLKLDLDAIESRYREDTARPLAEIVGRLASMRENLDRSLASVRRISSELRPGVLDHLGIAAAIAWQTQEFQSRTGIRCETRLIPENLALDSQQSTGVFRILQELLPISSGTPQPRTWWWKRNWKAIGLPSA